MLYGPHTLFRPQRWYLFGCIWFLIVYSPRISLRVLFFWRTDLDVGYELKIEKLMGEFEYIFLEGSGTKERKKIILDLSLFWFCFNVGLHCIYCLGNNNLSQGHLSLTSSVRWPFLPLRMHFVTQLWMSCCLPVYLLFLVLDAI